MTKHLLLPLATLGLQTVCAQEKPNVIVFIVDDMGVMDTSVPFLTDTDGNPVKYPLNDWYRTPSMERLSEQGTRFTRFYAQSVSSPSRASVMTGQNSTRHRTTNWINAGSNNKTPYGPTDWNWMGLCSESVTMPQVLRGAGYKTIHVGKAHFGCSMSEGVNPVNVGFDVNVAGSGIGHPGSYYGEHGYGHLKGAKSHAVPGLEKYHGQDMFLSEALTVEAKQEISKAVKEGRPFFLHMAHYAAHSPFETDKRFIENYAHSDKSQQAKAFATLIEGMDKSLGDVMDHLQELGIAENTLIVFLGDNGSDAPMGQMKGITSSAPLRGKKGTEYEGGTRIPFIVGWAAPNTEQVNQRRMPIKCGAIQSQIGTVMDIFPTVLDLAGCEIPKNYVIDGYNLKKQLKGGKCKRPEQVLMHFPHAHNESYFTTFMQGEWKLIYNYNPETSARPGYRLYNLKADPSETEDLSSKYPKRVEQMVKTMSRQLEKETALYPEDKQGNTLKPFWSKQ
ncbi:MAG: sulfatase [Marinifilaceae bacterium]